MKSTVTVLSTLLVTTFGFNSVATANESLVNTTDQQNQQEIFRVQSVGAETSVSVNTMAIAEQVINTLETSNSHGGLVKGVLNQTSVSAEEGYNVLKKSLNFSPSVD